jgi:hypothetical protein
MEYYSVIKKNEIVLFIGKWMELEITKLSEINQVHMFSLIYGREIQKLNVYTNASIIIYHTYPTELVCNNGTV